MTEEIIFHEALLKTAGERNAYLEDACSGKPELLAALKSLLAAHEASSGFLKQLPHEPGLTEGPKPVTRWSEATGEYPPNQEGQKPSTGGITFSPIPGPGLVIAGRYTLVEKIGEGGMGVVWVANQTEPIKRKVALKVIKTGMDSRSVLARFEQERQALALMDHPNIARVLDGGMTPTGQPFFVMELVNGLALNKFCDEARLTLRERLDLFVPICQAIQHAHQKGIIHRDLKPANILVTLVDGRPIPKVIDFGVAKATGDKIIDDSISTHFGAVVGTLEYMSPEQAGLSSEGIDTRSDIYSLGVILYELLTGLRPFDSTRLKKAALTEVIRIIREEDPSRPSTRLSTNESLPSLAAMRRIEPRKLMSMLRGELDWVVMKCLEKSRDRRYETANGLARDIQRYLADEPVEARPPSAGYRFGKFMRRNKGVVIATTLVFLSLVGGIIGTTMGLIQAEKNRAEAEKAWGEEALRAEGEREAKEQETKQRESAEKARDRTRQALDDMTSIITGESLATQEAISEDQKKFLAQVIFYYQELSRENPYNEESRFRSAEAAYRVGLIDTLLEKREKAIESFQISRSEFDILSKEFPGNNKYKNLLNQSTINLSILFTTLGKNEIAENLLNKSLDSQILLVLTNPSFFEYKKSLALIYNNLGTNLREQGKTLESRKQNQLALNIQKELVEKFPKNSGFRRDLGKTHRHIGLICREMGKRSEAQEHFETAIKIQEKLTTEFPNYRQYKDDLSSTYQSLGNLERENGFLNKANFLYKKSIFIKESLTVQFPGVPYYQDSLAITYNNLGGLLNQLGFPTKALEEHQKALKILNNLSSENPFFNDYLLKIATTNRNIGLLQIKIGKPEESIKSFSEASLVLNKLFLNSNSDRLFRNNLAKAYYEQGKIAKFNKSNDEALMCFEKTVLIIQNISNTFILSKPERDLIWSCYREKAVTLFELGSFKKSSNEWLNSLDFCDQINLPWSYYRLGICFLHTGDLTESKKSFDKGFELRIFIENADNLNKKENNWLSCIFLFDTGFYYANLKHHQESITWYSRAINHFNNHYKNWPSQECLEKLIWSYRGRAMSNHAIGLHKETLADWEKIIELQPSNENPLGRTGRAFAWVHTNKVLEAVREVEDMITICSTTIKNKNLPTSFLFDFSRIYSIASSKTIENKQAYTDRAIALLQEALKGGYKDANQLETDPDLNPLRQREDFKKILATLNPPSHPKKP